MAILGVDVGGTFTDAVLLDAGRVSTGKVLTAPRQEESVLAAARAAGAERVERFAHGTTVATNALLERKGARTAFVTNAASRTSCTCAARHARSCTARAPAGRSRSSRSNAATACAAA